MDASSENVPGAARVQWLSDLNKAIDEAQWLDPASLRVVVGVAGLYTHYFFAFIGLACGAWMLLRPGRLPRPTALGLGAIDCGAALPVPRILVHACAGVASGDPIDALRCQGLDENRAAGPRPGDLY